MVFVFKIEVEVVLVGISQVVVGDFDVLDLNGYMLWVEIIVCVKQFICLVVLVEMNFNYYGLNVSYVCLFIENDIFDCLCFFFFELQYRGNY